MSKISWIAVIAALSPAAHGFDCSNDALNRVRVSEVSEAKELREIQQCGMKLGRVALAQEARLKAEDVEAKTFVPQAPPEDAIVLKGYWVEMGQRSPKQAQGFMNEATTLGGAPVKVSHFKGNSGEWVLYIDFDPDSFDQIKIALGGKYKLACEKSIVQTAMGAKYQQEECSTRTTRDHLTFSKYAGKISDGSLIIQTIAATQRSARKREADKNDL